MIKKIFSLLIVIAILTFSGCKKAEGSLPSFVSENTQQSVQSSVTDVSSYDDESDTSSVTSQSNEESSVVSGSKPQNTVSSQKPQTSSSKPSQDTVSTDTRPSASADDFTALSMEDYYCYNKLTAPQKEAYKAIYEMVGAYTSGDKMINGVKPEDISVAYTAVHNDNPQFFWMGQGYAVITKTTGSNVSYGIRTNPDNTGFITKSKAERDQKLKQLNQKVDSIIASVVKKGMTKDEIVKALHDYICENTVYNYNYSSQDKNKFNWTAYGALIENIAVCEGYSKAFQILLNRVGIQSTVIGGLGDGGAHQWNAVNVGGWKTIDVTWDDHKNGGFGYTYYNKASINPSSKHKAYVHISKAGLEEIQQGKFNFFTELK